MIKFSNLLYNERYQSYLLIKTTKRPRAEPDPNSWNNDNYKPSLLRNNTSDKRRNVLQIVVGTEDVRSSVIGRGGDQLCCFLRRSITGTRDPPFLQQPTLCERTYLL